MDWMFSKQGSGMPGSSARGGAADGFATAGARYARQKVDALAVE
jgi:hypothetical protein